MLSIQGAWDQFLVRELSSHTLRSTAKRKNKIISITGNSARWTHEWFFHTSKNFFYFLNLFLIFWLCHMICGILVRPPGIEPTHPALEGEVLTTGLQGSPSRHWFFFKGLARPQELQQNFLNNLLWVNWLGCNRRSTNIWAPQPHSHCLLNPVQFPRELKGTYVSDKSLYIHLKEKNPFCLYCL